MTRVTIRRDAEGYISGFRVEGHAGFAPKGEDLVCAGISAITFTAMAGLNEVAGIDQEAVSDPKTAQIIYKLPDGITQSQFSVAQIILETMRLGFVEMAVEYPEFIEVFNEGGANLDSI